jgi:hypothetical protein
LLKTKAFIMQKSLDTSFHGTIRFLPESSDGSFEPPLELFSLEKRPPGCRVALFFYFEPCLPWELAKGRGPYLHHELNVGYDFFFPELEQC